ncbi:MAG: DUF72 domain-containing protein [Cyclobacteriaceae bacterium]|nr:DUF72 domain-containing protein [Cyclobacteriaceae bacterium]
MKFGSIPNPEAVDFTLPPDHLESKFNGAKTKPLINVGCAKWNRQDLKGFYPRGTKDELIYYATQFNSIELNATFYNFSKEQVEKWKDKTPNDFKFFPKVSQTISHFKRLRDTQYEVEEYCDAMSLFEEKLGMVFLQLIDNFRWERNFDNLKRFVEEWPKAIPLAVEVRSSDWFDDPAYYEFLEKNNVSHVITDTGGRRNLLHMRLTTPKAFIRYVGSNHPSDYSRLDDWVKRIGEWIDKGIDEINFFVHQNMEKSSPLLSAYFIEQLNMQYGYKLKVPNAGSQTFENLF